MVGIKFQAPARDRAEIGGETEERQQPLRRQPARLAAQGRDFHRREGAIRPVQRLQLIGDHQLHFAARGRGIELRRTRRGGAEFSPPVHHVDFCRDPAQGERPVHRGIAAARDHHARAAKILAPAHVVLHRAAGLVAFETGERRAVGAKRAGAGRQDHRGGSHRVAPVGAERKTAGAAVQPLHPSPEQARHVERGDLALQKRDQLARRDHRVGGDVENRLFRVERRALAAGAVQGVDQHAAELQHAALERGEQPDRAGAHDRHVGFDLVCHGGAR